ncbi:hypothetical protein BKA70DRAFT_1433707 [Coprinopsis sp. MPI-PUGE-AT-0042]|nr:hypothetical protein BKA70DRAFT_1433707 [Coprinopsis sp. MPI-PUGE-AT-0042]
MESLNAIVTTSRTSQSRERQDSKGSAKSIEHSSNEYLLTSYNHFGNIATFTGGFQIAVLSFINDLFSGDSINLELYRPQTGDLACGKRYTFFSLGLMIGVIAACVHIGVAAIAASNAALTCRLAHLTANNRTKVPDMGSRAVYCMALLFVAFNLSGASMVSLCIDYDVAFTVTVAMVYFGGLIVAVFQLIDNFVEDMKWLFGWGEVADPVRFLSCMGLGPVLALAVLWPAPSSWYPFILSCLTLMHHMFASLTSRLEQKKHNGKLSLLKSVVRVRSEINENRLAACAAALALAWGGCVAAAATWGLQDHLDEKEFQLGISGLAACQAAILCFIAALGWGEARRLRKLNKP